MAQLEETGQADGEGKIPLKKLIILIVAAVLLVVGGGVTTFFLMKGDDSSSKKAEQAEENEAAVPAEKAYFEISKPLIIDFPRGSAVQHARITLSMLADSAETMEVLRRNEPMIRNNLLMLVGGQDSNVLNSREGKETLRNAMLDDVNAVVKKMAEKGQVEEIFFTSFVMQ